ncbi:hypothetical protein BXZ70DRAFT_915109 [Cristinia sonorae]|uniref:Arrestin-like N-terminal domain-containing protein n=1 Tax=Cristinia sonorae TaxID=1940300 RepID=A0A8K0UWS2_9AGAR|nr:hypothetical protein BXZ70DRAFT_915109 [Cristinia sonorae]
MPEHSEALPGYEDHTLSSPVLRQEVWGEQTYTFDTKGGTWLWLKLKSRSTRPSDETLPLYYEKDSVQGTVEVDFSKMAGGKGIRVTVHGGIMTVGEEEVPFLDISKDIWDAQTLNGQKPHGKLAFPFSIPLPSEVSVPEKYAPKAPMVQARLPPTFSERASTVYINYRIEVTLRRSALKTKQSVSKQFVYIPLSRAEPPSPLRYLAYQEHTDVLGPEADPEGWKVFAPITVTGTLFGTKQVAVTCRLAIAQPLSFAVGSPVPLHMTLTSVDQHALDLFSQPSSIVIQLIRERFLGAEALREDEKSKRTDLRFQDLSGSNVAWKPSGEGEPVSGKKILIGELLLGKALKPTFTFPRFAIKYSIVLQPFKVPGFVATTSDPLIKERVEIHALNAPGFSPRSDLPPGYEHQEGDSTSSFGFLENGDQRYYTSFHSW